jgi:heme/copper-type cytochrome/quinol oxidase subunit 2
LYYAFIILHKECFVFKKLTTTLHQVGAQSIQKVCSTKEGHPASKDSTPTWVWGLLAFIVIGILGNVIYLVIKDRRRWKKEKMQKRDSIDYNPTMEWIMVRRR